MPQNVERFACERKKKHTAKQKKNKSVFVYLSMAFLTPSLSEAFTNDGNFSWEILRRDSIAKSELLRHTFGTNAKQKLVCFCRICVSSTNLARNRYEQVIHSLRHSTHTRIAFLLRTDPSIWCTSISKISPIRLARFLPFFFRLIFRSHVVNKEIAFFSPLFVSLRSVPSKLRIWIEKLFHSLR